MTMVIQFNIDDGILRRSMELLQITLEDANHNYLEFSKLPRSAETNEIGFISVGDSKNEKCKGYRKEIALRLRCFHHYVGNTDRLEGERTYHQVDFKLPYQPLKFLSKYVCSFARRFFAEAGIGDMDIERLVDEVEIVFAYSQLFVLPFPAPIFREPNYEIEEAKESKKRKILYDKVSNRSGTFSQSRGYFKSYRQIEANVVDETDRGGEPLRLGLISNISLPFIGFPPNQILKEWNISYNVHNGLIEPVKELLMNDFDNPTVEAQYYGDRISVPDYCFQVKVENSVFSIPIELKLSGVFKAFRDRDAYFSDLINQSMYQMLTLRSSIGFIFDKECIMIIKLFNNETPELTVEELTQIRLARLKCSIQCVKFKDTNPALIFYRSMFRYIQNATPSDQFRVNSIFKDMELTANDKTAVTAGKYEFMRNEWRSEFSEYKPRGDYFIRYLNSRPTDIRIPKGFFNRKLLNFKTTIHREDFRDITSIQDNWKNGSNYHSNVFRLTYTKEPNLNRRMILKIYDPVSSPEIASHTQGGSFQKTFAFSLSMYFNELRSYKLLRDDNSNGPEEEKPESQDGPAPTLHYTPYMYESGFIDWPGEKLAGNDKPTEFCGFFLLLEEISEGFPDTEEEYQEAARQALQNIHLKGLLHGDVNNRNFRYDSSRNRVIFFDFGLSKYTNSEFKDKSEDLISSTAEQKQAELAKLGRKVTVAFRQKPS
ncbi:hypothetical protein DFJ63DRAFT_311546 [Scheffersomyces coipomensis]|uniref:uncharacterized protein n=1 Tax=Scheffersomyces coipomensis TaxID=1788519 RepID=UPI00315D86EA